MATNRLMFGSSFGISAGCLNRGPDDVLRSLAEHFPGELKMERPHSA